jgi:hypothetical protein
MRHWTIMAGLGLLAACSSEPAADKAAEKAEDAASVASKMAIKPGLWETKISFKTLEADGIPAAAREEMLKATGNVVTVKSCVTQEQVDKPGADFFGTPQGSNCSFEQMDRSGNRMTVRMTCKPDGKTVIQNTMNGTISDDGYDMSVEQKTSGTPMGDMRMTGTLTGKRLGDCPA